MEGQECSTMERCSEYYHTNTAGHEAQLSHDGYVHITRLVVVVVSRRALVVVAQSSTERRWLLQKYTGSRTGFGTTDRLRSSALAKRLLLRMRRLLLRQKSYHNLLHPNGCT